MTPLGPPARKPRRPRPRTAGDRPEAVNRFPVWPEPKFRLTVAQYHAMIRTGVLKQGTPVELLDGELVWKDHSAAGKDPPSIGMRHRRTLDVLAGLTPRLKRRGCVVRAQSPLRLSEYDELEPDVTILLGGNRDQPIFAPDGADALCVIEVSDGSLDIDRGTRLSAYANGGVSLYMIVNLVDNRVEWYGGAIVGRGRYATLVTLGPKDKLVIPAADGRPLMVPVRSLLP